MNYNTLARCILLLVVLGIGTVGCDTEVTTPESPEKQAATGSLPTAFYELDNEARSDLNEARNAGVSLTAVADEYLAAMQNLDPAVVGGVFNSIYTDTFGETFVLGTDGIRSQGLPGPVDPSSFTTVEAHPSGTTALLTDLQLYEVDQSQLGFPSITYSPEETHPAEIYFYSARFGLGSPHAGVALRFQDDTVSYLSLAPMIQTSSGSLNVDDIAAFLGMVSNYGFQATPFSQWASSRGHLKAYGKSHVEGRRLEVEANKFCDTGALEDCLNSALDQWRQDNQEDRDWLDGEIARITEEWGNVPGLWEWLAGGAVTGGIAGAGGGSLIGGVGAIPGAIGGALAGLIGGGVAWLVGRSTSADDAREDIANTRAEYESRLCANYCNLLDAAVHCFEDFCPSLSAAASRAANQAKAQSGC